MLRQAENRVKIEGILNEIDLEARTFTKKDGTPMDGISGSIIVKVNQKIGGEDKELMIPVHVFSYKTTNAGKPNPAYESLMRVKNEFVSVAAAGNEDEADRVRITGANIRMNEYYSQDGRLIAFPRINASFINIPDKEVKTYGFSPRGAGYLFGEEDVVKFNRQNNIDLIARAHQLIQEGYQFLFNDRLVTVWSAPNYCYRCGNDASIMEFDEHMNRGFKIFEACPENVRSQPDKKPAPEYFL